MNPPNKSLTVEVFDSFELPPGAYENININYTLEKTCSPRSEIKVRAVEISMKSNSSTSNLLYIDDMPINENLFAFTGYFSVEDEEIHKNTVKNISKSKIHMKCLCISVSIVNGSKKPILSSFLLKTQPR